MPSGLLASILGICMAVARTVLSIPFRLPQISCFIFSLKCFSSDSDNCSDVGIGPLLQFSHPLTAGPFLVTLLFYPLVPSSYGVLRGSLHSFCWSGAPVHPQLVFCMHCTFVSEGVFLYPWKEMYSMSTYSSVISFLSTLLLLKLRSSKIKCM